MKKPLKRQKLLLSLTICVFAVSVLYGSSELYKRRDYQSRFIELKGELVSTRETPLEHQSGYVLNHVQLENDTGIKVEGHVRIPSSNAGPYPSLVLLGGLRTGKRVLDYIQDSEDIVLLALDYPYEEKKGKYTVREFLAKLPDMRRAIVNTVPAVMLSIDYLLEKEEVDADRIVLVGGSVGALFAPAIAACDQRISAVAILFGAGDLQSLIRANVELPPPLPAIAGWVGGLLVSPVEPLKYVDRISPRPLFMLNGTDDPRMPTRCTRLLYEKAKQPKVSRWIPSGHLHIRSAEFHQLVRNELVSWLVQNELISADSAAVAPVSP
jgi:dienelactone hydrolase